MIKSHVHRLAVFALVAVLLAVQPAAQFARAQEASPVTFVVAGVAGATLRAEPHGASNALAVVPAGASVSMAGPDVVTSGIVWRHIRTADGVVGYVPAGLLVQTGGAPVQATAPAMSSATAGASTAPASSAEAAPAASTDDDAARAAAASRGADPTASPTPPAAGRRTTVERRRDREVTIAHLDTERAPDGRQMGAGQVVVKFKPGANQTARSDAHRVAGARSTSALRLPDTAVVDIQTGTVAQALAAYRARSDVLWAEPDYIRRATVTPDDPDYASQQWNLQKVGAQAAWDQTNGTTAPKIAILDCGMWTKSSGVSFPDGLKGHADLREKVAIPADERNFSGTQDADDWCNHGSLMAGIAGASTNNGIGVAGLGFNAKLMNVKVLDDTGEGQISWLAQGITWAVDNGARVISMSLGGEGACSFTEQAAIDYAWSKGAVIVAAAGNGGADGVGDPLPEAPGNCNHVIPVGAIDRNDNRASFSNYNANPALGPVVPLAAPGYQVYSTTSYDPYYTTVNGTSPATPHVAAAAALIMARHPGDTNTAVVNRLISTADPIIGTGTHWANGRLNAPAALGGVTCSPRPNILVTSTVVGTALNVLLNATGTGNAIRYIQINGAAGTPVNGNFALPSVFPGGPNITALQWQGAATYVPSATSNLVTVRITRQTAGSPTTVPMKVQDVCGTWNTFVGGGTAAGF